MILRLSSWKDYHEGNLISFGFNFLTSLAFIEVVFWRLRCVLSVSHGKSRELIQV